MENKELNIQLFAKDEEKDSSTENEATVEVNESEEPTPTSNIDINTNTQSNEDTSLDKFKPENVDRKPSKEELARRKKRGKRAIIATVTVALLAGIGVWVAASTFVPPVCEVNSIQGNTLVLKYGNTTKSFDFSKGDVKVVSQWYNSNRQLMFTINGGIFSGYSFTAWMSQSNVQQDIASIGLKDGWSPDGSATLIKNFAINLSTKQIGSLDSITNTFTAATTDSGDLASKLSTAISNSTVQSGGPNFLLILINLLPTILAIVMIIYFVKMLKSQGGSSGGDSIFGIGKAQAKLAESNVKFSDVAGIQEEKSELIEIVDYLKRPAKYAAMGARTPKGIILYGPPGTGKTLLAKAVAGEAGVPFFEASGSSFEDMLVGVGAKRVRDLFAKASAKAPAIIFIDEIDSVASKRGKNEIAGASGGIADQTINQLLAEMDGFSSNSGVIVIAATNRLDVLDPAILRPGRFDRHIQINLPDIKERVEILKIHARNKNISSSVNLDDIARRTPGFSGAQLENVLNEATLLAVRENKNVIGMHELDEAIDRVIAGPAKQTRTITLEEKKQIAYHEAGHALVGLHNPGSDVVQKITIIPRGNAAGYTLSTPEKQEMQIQRKSDLLGLISSTLGGRAAEEFIYGKENISTGAANDLYKVTNIVRAMVMQLGMSSLGMTQFVPSEGTVNPYAQKLYSEVTAQQIDKEVDKIIDEQYKRAINVIKNNKKELDLLVDALLTLETITKDQIDYIHKNKKLPKEVLDRKKKGE